jgi:hypothetical protein
MIELAIGPDGLTEMPARLAALAGSMSARRRVLAIGLVPPLVEVKYIDLPPLTRPETERVLARDSERYFLRGGGRVIVSARRFKRPNGRGRTVLAAMASADVIEAIYGSAEAAGWRIGQVTPSGLGNPVLDLVPDERLQAGDCAVRRWSQRALGFAAALVVAAAALEWWGTARELERVAAARRTHRAEVAEAMAVRDELQQWAAKLAALDSIETEGRSWTLVLATLATHLPRDAHLTALKGSADTVLIEGVAHRAAAGLEALQRSADIERVRVTAPIRQESGDSAAPRERFVAAVQFRSGGAE